MRNGVHVKISALGFSMRAHLKQEAISELIALVEKYRTEEERIPDMGGHTAEFPPSFFPGPVVMELQEQLKRMPREDLAELFSTLTAGEGKMLLLMGWLEARTSPPVTKVQLRDLFVTLGKPPPSNPGRDLKNMLENGLLHRSADGREVMLGEAGWERLKQFMPFSQKDGQETGCP